MKLPASALLITLLVRLVAPAVSSGHCAPEGERQPHHHSPATAWTVPPADGCAHCPPERCSDHLSCASNPAGESETVAGPASPIDRPAPPSSAPPVLLSQSRQPPIPPPVVRA